METKPISAEAIAKIGSAIIGELPDALEILERIAASQPLSPHLRDDLLYRMSDLGRRRDLLEHLRAMVTMQSFGAAVVLPFLTYVNVRGLKFVRDEREGPAGVQVPRIKSIAIPRESIEYSLDAVAAYAKTQGAFMSQRVGEAILRAQSELHGSWQRKIMVFPGTVWESKQSGAMFAGLDYYENCGWKVTTVSLSTIFDPANECVLVGSN